MALCLASSQNAITGKYRKGKPPLINNKNVRTPTNKFEAKWDEGLGRPKPKEKPEDKTASAADPKAAADPKTAGKDAKDTSTKESKTAEKDPKAAGAKAGAKPVADDDDDDGTKEEPKLWVGNFRYTHGGLGLSLRTLQGLQVMRALSGSCLRTGTVRQRHA